MILPRYFLAKRGCSYAHRTIREINTLLVLVINNEANNALMLSALFIDYQVLPMEEMWNMHSVPVFLPTVSTLQCFMDSDYH